MLLLSVSFNAEAQTDSLLIALDRTIAGSERFEEQKNVRIVLIKEELRLPHLLDTDLFRIYNRLFQEYESYNCDSACHYINLSIAVARQAGYAGRLNELMIRKANVLATTGLYPEALQLLREVNPKELSDEGMADYYLAFANTYLYQAEYTSDNEYAHRYLDSMQAYRDSALLYLPEGSYRYVITKVPALIDEGRMNEAEKVLHAHLAHHQSGTRDYSVLTSILAFLYQQNDNPEQQKIHLIRSAISDIQAVVKENNSLRALAELLYEEGQLARANHYMKVSVEDANSFNARLRNIQASKMLPMIDSAYQKERDAQRNQLQSLLLIISVLSVFLMAAVIYVIVQMRRVGRARRKVIEINKQLKLLNSELTGANNRQHLANSMLSEANHIKEEYIGRFLGLCSAYIEKLEAYRRMLNRKAAAGQVEELYKTLKSNRFIEDELREFYVNFDASFLNIFPDFVERFNTLLPPEERIVPKQGERLTTELRIFALIRLGISDSRRIAGFLRYSITTIYTYRSKLRNRSLYKDSFEEEVMKIGAF